MTQDTLRARLRVEPRELKFGTSGRRGLVADLTQLEIFINVRAELEYLQSLPLEEGGVRAGDAFYLAGDLRPSSNSIAEAVWAAAADAGMKPEWLGRIPTPALMAYAVERGRGSVMVTGSHIPFDRNGYKLNTSRGELLKLHEAPIGEHVAVWRARLYGQAFGKSMFDEAGELRREPKMGPKNGEAREAYKRRYVEFFGARSLKGARLLVYQHSAVGRDLLAETLLELGAEVRVVGRSETFVPIDTENIGADELAAIQALADEERGRGPWTAVVSTDGDSDRPLILGVDGASGRVRFFGGDLVGMVVAEALGADAVVVPISCNDAIDRGALAGVLEAKTRIGSPYVIAGMEAALESGKRRVCGWEANGGFLVGSELERGGARLKALATRDAFLPIVAVLVRARELGLTLDELFARLPARYSRAALLRNFPRAVSVEMLAGFEGVGAREKLERYFNAARGFAPVARIDYTDGVRAIFENGEVGHLRPSGNADELRIYAVADRQERADEIAAVGVAEPDGILREMERDLRG